jgi:hypothetical protein
MAMPQCDLLLVVATPTEQKELEAAARARGWATLDEAEMVAIADREIRSAPRTSLSYSPLWLFVTTRPL